MNFLMQDLRFGVRTLLKSPGFTAIAVMTLALGIGANAAIFSILNALLFRPLPMVENPNDIVVLANRDSHMEFPHGLSYIDYRDFRTQNEVFDELAIYTPWPVGLSGEGRADRTWGLFVSGGFFSLFETDALQGSALHFDDSSPTGGEPLIVLGHSYWQRSYGGDATVIGKTLEVNGAAFTVAGVMPEGFNGSETIFDIDIYLPMTALHLIRDDAAGMFASRESHIFRGVARLREGVTADEAQVAMQLMADRLGEEYPDTNAEVALIVVEERKARPEPSTYGLIQPISIAFMGLVSLVLFIACANVANLLIARGASRGRELATRTALGAGRIRIIRQLLTEALLLALMGGAVGILIAEWASAYITSTANNLPVDIPINFNFRPDIRVYGFTFGAALVSCIVAGLVPAWQTSRVNLQDALRDGRSSSASKLGHRLRKFLVVSQLAISLLLLICAGLFMQSLVNARTMDMGFQRGNMLLLSVDPISQGYDEARGRQLYEEMVTRVEALPGVHSASIAGFIPFSGAGLSATNVYVVGSEQVDDEDALTVFYNTVDHRYFQTMGVPLLKGRSFTEMDTSESPDVVVVNETMARQLWPGEDPLGRQLRLDTIDGPECEVVGVARDGKYMLLAEDPRPFMYRPLTQDYPGLMANLHVRTEVDPMALAPTVRNTVQALDEHMPIFDVKDLEVHLTAGNALMPFRMGAMMVGSFGMLGVVLATIGIYGVIAYSVTNRTHEFGVRMALGASGRDVLTLVLREGLVLTAVGVVVGLLFAFATTPSLSGMLLDVAPFDVVLFGAVTLLLILVALLACYLPARRATRVDPMVALRYE